MNQPQHSSAHSTDEKIGREEAIGMGLGLPEGMSLDYINRRRGSHSARNGASRTITRTVGIVLTAMTLYGLLTYS